MGDYFEKKGKDSSRSGNESSSNGDSDKTLDKAVSWGRQVRARMDDHSKRTRLQRLVSYNVAIAFIAVAIGLVVGIVVRIVRIVITAIRIET